jgi:methylase of polypeptide subunit release factors
VAVRRGERDGERRDGTVEPPGEERAAFGPLSVVFDPRVLRPRPWTLAQSEWAAELSPGVPNGPILELAAGAGHIGLAAAVLTGRPLVQVDLSDVACSYARTNARAAGRPDVEVRCGRFGAVLEPAERFPLVIADPPYVPSAEVAQFADDPTLAIDGGPDGLVALRECLTAAGAHVAADGVVLLQTRGERQARQALSRWGRLSLVQVRTFGADRAVALARPSPAGPAA